MATWDIFHAARLEVERGLSTEEVRARLARGELREDDLARPAGTSTPWARLLDLPELAAPAAPAEPRFPTPDDEDEHPGGEPILTALIADDEDEDEDEEDEVLPEPAPLMALIDEDEPIPTALIAEEDEDEDDEPARDVRLVPEDEDVPAARDPRLAEALEALDEVRSHPRHLAAHDAMPFDERVEDLDLGQHVEEEGAEYDPEEEDEEAASFTLSRGSAEKVEELDLAAMVDVAFNLVMFFLVTATTVLYKTLEIPKPNPEKNPGQVAQAQSRTMEDLQGDYIIVEVDPAGAVKVDHEPAPARLDALAERLRKARQDTGRTKMLLTADFATPHRNAVMALDAANEVGMGIALARPAAAGSAPPPAPTKGAGGG